MDEQSAILRLVIDRLEAVGIPYMLTGSLALALYAAPRMTRDVDVVIDCDDAAADKLVAAFTADSYINPESVHTAIRLRGMFNAIHEPTVSKVDFIVRKDDEYRRTEFGRRRQLLVSGKAMWVVAPEDLLLSKLLWAQQSDSERQLTDAASILRMQGSLDQEYLQSWAERLGLTTELDRAANR
jgi:hypothetical protein